MPFRHRSVPLVTIATLAVAAAALAATFGEHDLNATWNVALASAEGAGYGTASFDDGDRTAGSDTIVTAEGEVESGEEENFSSFFNVYEVFADGIALGFEDQAAFDSHEAGGDVHGALLALSETGASAVAVGVRVDEHAGEEAATLFALAKTNALETPALFGPTARDTFVGGAIRLGPGETEVEHAPLVLFRALDTAARVTLAGGAAAAETFAGAIDVAASGGVAVFRPDVGTTRQVGGSAGAFDETAASYRAAFTAETRFVALVRDTAPASTGGTLLGLAVRPRSPLDTGDVFGSWQVAVALPEEDEVEAVLALLELQGDGTGTYDNGEEGAHRRVTTCTFAVGTTTLGGALAAPGESFVGLFLQPEAGGETIEVRLFVSDDTRLMAGAGPDAEDAAAAVGVRRANSAVRSFEFGTARTVVDEGGVRVSILVERGATAGRPRFSVSVLSAENAVREDFQDLRDSALAEADVTSLRAAVSIVPDTAVLAPDSITVTIAFPEEAQTAGLWDRLLRILGPSAAYAQHVHGGEEEGGGGAAAGSILIPVVFDAATGRWTRISEDSVVERTSTSVSFKMPHFSIGGLAVLPAPNPGPEVSLCLVERWSVLGRLLVPLRSARDALLRSTAGRLVSAAYYLAGDVLSWLGPTPAHAQAPPPEPDEAAGPVAPARPAGLGGLLYGGRSGIQPQIGVVLDGTLETRSRGRDRANLRSVEVNLGAPVDPYFDLYAALLFAEGVVELEEGYATANLGPLSPAWLEPVTRNLQARFGKMLVPFGHLGGLHLDAFPQVDAPRVVGEFLGGEGLNEVGGWIEYQAPWARRPTFSLLVGAYDGDGEGSGGDENGDGVPDGPFSGEAARGPLWLGRITSYLDWGEGRHGLRVSGSWLSDANDNFARTRTEIWSVEGKYRWAIDEAGRALSLGGEYVRQRRGENPSTVLRVNGGRDLATEGAYLWGLYDWNRRWGLGGRIDSTHQLFSARNRTRSFAPYLEWRPTEFSTLRIEYRHDDRNFDLDGNGLLDDDEDRLFLQGLFFIGWHPAHKF